MLNLIFLVYAMKKNYILKGLNEDVYYKNITKLELKALMWKLYLYQHLQ